MIHIGECLVSEDVLAETFCCDLNLCKGGCCNSEGESGAPLDNDELDVMRALVEIVWNDITPRAQKVIREQGPYFKDKTGDYVTSVVEGRDCVFCTYGTEGMCFCAIEKAFREGKFSTLPQYHEGKEPFIKPISCHLYPIRLKNIGDYVAVNYDRQDKLCGCAHKLGKKLGIKVFQCLKDALIRKFGKEWYDELSLCESEMRKAGIDTIFINLT